MAETLKVRGLFDDGNAYSILGKCKRAARKAGWSDVKWSAFSAEAKRVDYDHLLQTVMRSFDEMSDDEEADDNYARMDAESEAENGR